MTREEIFDVLSHERDYQLLRWGIEYPSPFGGGSELEEAKHSIEEFVLYMEDYLDEARKQLSRLAEPEARTAALHTLRKVVTLGLAAFEQHGVPTRAPGPVTNGRTGKVYHI